MIRLPPSVLALGPRDLVEYEERRQHRELENVKKKFARFEIGAVNGPTFSRSGKSQTSSDEYVNTSETFPQSPKSTTLDNGLAGGDGYEEPRYSFFASPASIEDHSSVRSDVTSAENLSQVSVEVQHSPSPPKEEFHYGGFIQSRSFRRSSPFVPEDISRPRTLPHNAAGDRLRTLPRSPLYLSHNTSSSPEQQPTSSLTPRVASRVANHHTPGLMFSQPARRPATFRHQTNSFSFDSSERSSTAYEQDRISSLSTTDTTPRPIHDLRLHDELRGSSLASSKTSSIGGFIFSSPELPLPPPFSTRSRRVSDAMPSASPVIHPTELDDSDVESESNTFEHPQTSPVNRSPELIVFDMHAGNGSRSSIQTRDGSSPVNRSSRADDSAARPRSSTLIHPGGSSIDSAARLTDFRRSSAARIVSYYRPPSPSPSRAASSPRVQSIQSRHSRTPHLAIYNDSLPPHTQPQTPAHLHEARHRSRYHPSYTAPVTRYSGIFASNYNGLPLHRSPAPTTPSRRPRVSPVGLQSAGFQGLYGGRENGDDQQSWVDGVRFGNAEVRLWGMTDGAGDGRTLGDTPEREEWRIGRL